MAGIRPQVGRAQTGKQRTSIRIPGRCSAGSMTMVLVAACGCLCTLGCNRGFYRRTADRDAYCLVNEKGRGPTWRVEPSFTVEPDHRSRFYDPTCPTDPTLPLPAPKLYGYGLPTLVTTAPPPRQLNAEDQLTAEDLGVAEAKRASSKIVSLTPPPGEQPTVAVSNIRSLDPPAAQTVVLASASNQSTVIAATPLTQAATPVPATPVPATSVPATSELSSENDSPTAKEAEEIVLPLPAGPDTPVLGQEPLMQLPPVPPEAWNRLPESCLKRMLEFEAVRMEYFRSFERQVSESQLDSAQRVNLENIMEIALINSREYQTRKETLYRVALRLSFQRFDYDLKFLSRGNGTLLDYSHSRTAGVEVNRLAVPTGLGITRSLYSGGDLIARFANDVVLTFNGPSGFSSSVGSEIFIDLFQPIMQRDIRFEPLTQAERDVVYAARDFVRFRKVLFRDLATQYYALLLTYRGIAINTQDYFSNLREFNRAAATERADRMPLVQVDQFEQNVLRSRGNLINSCNALEGALDRLKVRIGLPTEMPINVALTELEEITLRDEASVLREELARKTKVFLQRQEREGIAVAIPALTQVAQRMLNLAQVNARVRAADGAQIPDLEILVAILAAEEKRVEARESEAKLTKNAAATGEQAQMLPAQLFPRYIEAIQLNLEAVRQELSLLSLLMQSNSQPTAELSNGGMQRVGDPTTDDPTRKKRAEFEQTLAALQQRWDAQVAAFSVLDGRLKDIPFADQAALLPALNAEAAQSLNSAIQLEMAVAAELTNFGVIPANSEAELRELADEVLDLHGQLPSENGLPALEVNVDEAMLTALVQRLDLMNRRGQLADEWRLIKYAGDDLKSILNLRATQSIRTPTGSNNPFDFSLDDSTTRLTMNFDTPLNRRSERNLYRLALIDYNVALRNVIEAEDNVKLDIRNELRNIELDRNQYEIAIASAALAYDRVTSTRMQVALGAGNVTARDFLEAQQAYTQSLSSVAQQHIGYIVDRIQFFLDLEQLQVDPVNFWPDLRNDSYPFIRNVDFGGATPDGYGTLPCGPWYSDCLRRMEQVPSGQAVNLKPAQ